MIVIHATGRIKATSIINGSIYIIVIPLTYIAFRIGMPSWIPFLYNAIAFSITSIIGIYLLHLYIPKFQAMRFFLQDVLRCLLMYAFIMAIVYSCHFFLEEGWLRLFTSIATTVFLTSLCSYYILLSKRQKQAVFIRIKEKFNGH